MRSSPLLDRLHIEVTNICNFKCDFCPDAVMERQRGHMDFALLERLLDEVAGAGLARVTAFHLMGEPLLYPRIFDAIALAVRLGIKLHLTTNGSTFALKPDHVSRLIASGVTKVTISVQTPDPGTYAIRKAPVRLTPDTYFAGIRDFVQAYLANPGSTTRVHLKFLDTTPHPFLVPQKRLRVLDGRQQLHKTLHEWAAWVLEGYGGWERDVYARINRARPGGWNVIPLIEGLALESFPLDSWGNAELDNYVPARFGYCNGASRQAGVLCDGTVVPCCKDYEGRIPLGNVHAQSLSAVLNGASACSLRSGFEHLRVENPVCARCLGADSSHKALLRQVGSILYFKAYKPSLKLLGQERQI